MTDITIKIEWSENGELLEGEEFFDIGAFDRAIYSVLPTCPTDGCYDKTKFTVTANGDTYTGRLDLVHRDSSNTGDQFYGLADHMRDHCNYQIERSTLATEADKHGARAWLAVVDQMEAAAKCNEIEADIAALEAALAFADNNGIAEA